MPDKKAFEALTEDRKRQVTRASKGMMDWLVLETVTIAWLVQLSMYSQRSDEAFSPFLIVVLALACVVSPVVAAVYIGRMQSETKQLLREQQQNEQ